MRPLHLSPGVQADHPYTRLDQGDQSDVAHLAVFPFCRCDEYRCGASPWEIVPISVENVTTDRYEDMMVMCWEFLYKGCDIQSDCCERMKDDVDKIEFDAGDGERPCMCACQAPCAAMCPAGV